MKKVIDGTTYDTEHATECGIYECYSPDVFYFCEKLYQDDENRKKYFLYRCVKFSSKYSLTTDLVNMEDILPINIDEANNWEKAHMDAEREFIYEPEE